MHFLSAALDILLMHEFDLCFVFTAFLKQDNFWLYVLQVSWSNLADVIYDARVEQLIDIGCFTQIKKQICGTSSSKILVMWQSEKKTSEVLGLKDAISPKRIPMLGLFILFSGCCPSLTTLCDPWLSIISYFIILFFQVFVHASFPQQTRYLC